MSALPESTRVLVVEDSGSIRALLCAIVRDAGYAVAGELSSGADFLSTVRRLMPDIILLDQFLPDCEGLSMLPELRAQHPEIAVVMITGTTDPDTHQAAVAAGIAGFIKKPFSQAKIIAELKQIDHARKLLKRAGSIKPMPNKGFRVLVADDSVTMRQLLSSIIRSIGVTVVGEACNGLEAVALAEQYHPDAICMDLEMPNMDGFEALTKIKAAHPYMHVIICTSHADRSKVQEAVKRGACGYVLKPFQPEQVIATMRKLLVA